MRQGKAQARPKENEQEKPDTTGEGVGGLFRRLFKR
jgi:hypothetical protein